MEWRAAGKIGQLGLEVVGFWVVVVGLGSDGLRLLCLRFVRFSWIILFLFYVTSTFS